MFPLPPQPHIPISYPCGELKWADDLSVSSQSSTAQVELLNAHLTELMTPWKLLLTLNPFKKYLTTWPKAYILWESPSLMRQLIARISKLHGEPSELPWKGSPGPLPKSPVKEGSPRQLRRPGVIGSSAYWFWIWERLPGGWCLGGRGRIWWGRRGPEGEAPETEPWGAPSLTRSGTTSDVLVLIFTGSRSRQAAFVGDDSPKESSCSLWGKKIFTAS